MRDRQQLLGYWTGDIIPYLQHHAEEDKRRLGTFFRRTTRMDLLAIIDEMLEI
ncbi:hypothetical protein BGZ51_000309, partial [Haplosporangium sp. Z 767]